jgi:hypothetical protein
VAQFPVWLRTTQEQPKPRLARFAQNSEEAANADGRGLKTIKGNQVQDGVSLKMPEASIG